MILSGIIYGKLGSRILAPAKITDRFVWLKGVHPDYLDSLPEFPYID
jgi:hypothetical protein